MPLALFDATLHIVILGYLGAGALLAGLVLGGFSTLLSFWAGARESPVFIQVARRAFYGAAGMTVLASVVLETALLTHDFSLAYVAEHTDLSTPIALVAAGFYGGQEGSLLYWTLILGVLGTASLLASARLGDRVAAYAAGILAAILTFFLFVLAVVASPFELLSVTPPDGLGLNPILRDGGMLIHPPVILAGFASFAIPFAFACAALMAGRVDASWIRHTRRFAADDRAPARNVVGLPRARLGRLLGMGPGRERRTHAVARHHGVPALRAGPGKARAHACVEFRVGHPRVPTRRVRHIHRAQRSRAFGAHVCGQCDRAMVSGLSRDLHRFLGGAAGIPRRRIRAGHWFPRRAGLARGCFRPPEPAADRGGCRRHVGHRPSAGLRLVAPPITSERPRLSWRRSWP